MLSFFSDFFHVQDAAHWVIQIRRSSGYPGKRKRCIAYQKSQVHDQRLPGFLGSRTVLTVCISEIPVCDIGTDPALQRCVAMVGDGDGRMASVVVYVHILIEMARGGMSRGEKRARVEVEEVSEGENKENIAPEEQQANPVPEDGQLNCDSSSKKVKKYSAETLALRDEATAFFANAADEEKIHFFVEGYVAEQTAAKYRKNRNEKRQSEVNVAKRKFRRLLAVQKECERDLEELQSKYQLMAATRSVIATRGELMEGDYVEGDEFEEGEEDDVSTGGVSSSSRKLE